MNPEAPMDSEDDDWMYGQVPRRVPPPKKPNLLTSILVLVGVIAVIGFSVYACSAKAADGTVTLIVSIITSAGKPDITHKEPMLDLKSCLEEAGNFLRHKFPDAVDARELRAGCFVRQAEDDPS